MAYSPSINPEFGLTPAIFRIRNLLQKIIRVTISDGRIFIGSFAGTDQPLNILVTNTEEYPPGFGLERDIGGRYVGQVVIPWRLVKKVEVEGTKINSGSNLPLHDQDFYI